MWLLPLCVIAFLCEFSANDALDHLIRVICKTRESLADVNFISEN